MSATTYIVETAQGFLDDAAKPTSERSVLLIGVDHEHCPQMSEKKSQGCA